MSLSRGPDGPNPIVGQNAEFLSLLKWVDRIAASSASVLITGETGTGKELIAQRLHEKSQCSTHYSIHYTGNCSQGAFVSLNCGALPTQLFESELFGHERGAFTGAVHSKPGLCELANQGTLFLDEIGELPLTCQPKVLRFLQSGEFYRVGGNRLRRVQTRVLSATNQDLSQLVSQNLFRQDLLYRLNAFTLRVPSLRERLDDIPLFVDYFLNKSGASYSAHECIAAEAIVVDKEVITAWQTYEWPGNIRELRNVLERVRVLIRKARVSLADLEPNFHIPRGSLNNFLSEEVQNKNWSLKNIERTHILQTLLKEDGNKSKAARSLGISLKTLYNKLARYHLDNFSQDSKKMNGSMIGQHFKQKNYSLN